MNISSVIRRMRTSVMSVFGFSVSIVMRVVYEVLPPIEFHWKNYKYDFSFRITENEEKLDEFREEIQTALSDISDDTNDILEAADKAHHLELDRSSELDSKAAAYLTNVGIVLSILSLIPLISASLGINPGSILSLSNLQIASVMIFGYAVLMFLLSAIYSYRAMKIAAFEPYYSTNKLVNRMKDDKFGEVQQVVDLMICRKKNEEYTQEKINTLFAAESLHRNGLIALAAGIILISVSFLM
jgi:hypothetical protein